MLRVQVQCYVRSQTALSALRACTACSSPVCARHSAPVKCVATLGFMCGAAEEEEGRLGRRAVRLHGRLLCRRRCNAASETCRKKPSGESGPESTLCALWSCWNCTTGTPAMALKRSALHWKHCVIGCCCETTWSVAASCRCNPCSALPLIIIVVIIITILVVIIVVIIIVIIVIIIVRALCASADKAGA